MFKARQLCGGHRRARHQRHRIRASHKQRAAAAAQQFSLDRQRDRAVRRRPRDGIEHLVSDEQELQLYDLHVADSVTEQFDGALAMASEVFSWARRSATTRTPLIK